MHPHSIATADARGVPLSQDGLAALAGPGVAAAAGIGHVRLNVVGLPSGNGETASLRYASHFAFLQNRQDRKMGDPAVQDLVQDSNDGTALTGTMRFNGAAGTASAVSGGIEESHASVALPRQAWGDDAIFLSKAGHRDTVTLSAHAALEVSGRCVGAVRLDGVDPTEFIGNVSANVFVGLFGPLPDQQSNYRNEASSDSQGAHPAFDEHFFLTYANNTDHDITVEINMSAYLTGTVGPAPALDR